MMDNTVPFNPLVDAFSRDDNLLGESMLSFSDSTQGLWSEIALMV